MSDGEDIPMDSDGRTAILSAPVMAVDPGERGARWSIGTADAVFHREDSAGSLSGKAGQAARFAEPILDALGELPEDPADPLYLDHDGPVAWAHVFADPADTDADASEYVNVVWAVERGEPVTDGGEPEPSAHHAASALHVLNAVDPDAGDSVRADVVPRILKFKGDADPEDIPEYAELREDAGKWTTAASIALAYSRDGFGDIHPDAHGLREWLEHYDTTETYDVKTIRVHEPERGRFVYVMVNRLDGRNHALGEMGFTGVYFQFSVMSQSADFRLTRLSAYEIKRDHPVEWFADSHAYRLIAGLDSGAIDWNALADEDQLTPEGVAALAAPTRQELRDAFADDSEVEVHTKDGEPFLFAYHPDAQDRAREWLDSNGYVWAHPEDPEILSSAVSVDGEPLDGTPRVFTFGGDGDD